MVNEIFMPHAEAYYDSENGFNLTFYSEPERSLFLDTAELGQALIDFAELDLEEYTKRLTELAEHSITKKPLNLSLINGFRNEVLALLEYAKTLHPYIDFFLHTAINEGLVPYDETVTAFLDSEGQEKEDYENGLKMIVNGFIKAFYGVRICYDTFYHALTACFNEKNEDTKEMEIGNKFWFFTDHYPQCNNFSLLTTYKLVPSANGKIKFDRITEGLTEEQQNAVNAVLDGNFIYTNVFLLYTLEEMLYFEFCHMLNSKIIMRVCQNCNRLYIVKGNYDTKYCSRVNDKGVPCSSRGAKRQFMNKLDNDKYLKEYDRIYQRLYAKFNRGTMSGTDFDKWHKNAKQRRKMYIAKEIAGEEFLEMIML